MRLPLRTRRDRQREAGVFELYEGEPARLVRRPIREHDAVCDPSIASEMLPQRLLRCRESDAADEQLADAAGDAGRVSAGMMRAWDARAGGAMRLFWRAAGQTPGGAAARTRQATARAAAWGSPPPSQSGTRRRQARVSANAPHHGVSSQGPVRAFEDHSVFFLRAPVKTHDRNDQPRRSSPSGMYDTVPSKCKERARHANAAQHEEVDVHTARQGMRQRRCRASQATEGANSVMMPNPGERLAAAS